MAEERPPIAVPFRLREAFVVPTGWPPDVLPNQLIASAHINVIRSSVYAWPGDVDAQNHKLKNVILEGVTGVVTDPTTTKGDLIARGPAAALVRLPAGANGQILVANSAEASGLQWQPFPAVGVSSVFGRAGVVTAQAGDYTAAQVTGAVSTAGSYSDPAWITSFAWSKLTGVPPTFPAAAHQHTASDIVSGVFSTARMGSGIADGTVFLRGDGTWSVPGGPGGVVPTARQVIAGYGLGGGGPLTADVTLFAVDNAAIQKVRVLRAGALVSARWGINLVEGSNVTISAVDDIANDRVNVTIASAGGGGTGGAVDSVFGRTGAVLAQAGDYHVSQVTNALADMTTSKGDLLARTTTALARLPVGADGLVLMADNAQPMGVKWAAAAPAAGVASFNTRTGAVMPVAGDYTAAMVTGAVVNPTSAKGDLMVRDVSVVQRLGLGSDGFVLTADSAQALGVKWAAVVAGAAQTPWTQDINAAGFRLISTGNVGIGTATPRRDLHIARSDFTELLIEATNVTDLETTGRVFGIGNSGGNLVIRALNSAASVATTPIMTITPAGAVGIGAAASTSRLTVTADSAAISGGSVGLAQVAIRGTDANKNVWMGFDTTSDVGFIQSGVVGVSWNNLLLNPSGGNVGVGTASPFNRLTVADASRAYTDAMVGVAGFSISSQTGAQVDDNLLFGVHTGDYSWIQATKPGTATRNLLLNPNGGNVGIGVTGPGYRLEVSGDVNVTGAYRVNGTAISAGGGFATQSVVTGSRALGTQYQNTTGKPMLVCVTLNLAGGASAAKAETGASSANTQIAAMVNGGSNAIYLPTSFVVLNNHYYKVSTTGGAVTNACWVEWT